MFRRNITLPQGNSDPVLSWQFVLPSCLESGCQPEAGAGRLSPTRPFGERSPTFFETSHTFEATSPTFFGTSPLAAFQLFTIHY
ncbi:MAG: hypothetical protein LBI18_04360 [Planctomycetaceae bacterium]|nr:hypothetical protein [Planctomycetaceae bacterium]